MSNQKLTPILEQFQHFTSGPIWDGNLISKSARDILVDAGLVFRCLHGYQSLTDKGVELAVVFGLLKSN